MGIVSQGDADGTRWTVMVCDDLVTVDAEHYGEDREVWQGLALSPRCADAVGAALILAAKRAMASDTEGGNRCE